VLIENVEGIYLGSNFSKSSVKTPIRLSWGQNSNIIMIDLAINKYI